jgi:phage shock protein E
VSLWLRILTATKSASGLEYNIRMKHIIDVREKLEFMLGHAKGAINIPLGTIEMHRTLPDNITKTDEIIVYCRSGNRSEQAAMTLRKAGYSNVTNGVNAQNVEAILHKH